MLTHSFQVFLEAFSRTIIPRLLSLRVLHLYNTKMPDALIVKSFDGFADMKRGGPLGNMVEVRLQLNIVWRRCSTTDDEWRMRVERPPIQR